MKHREPAAFAIPRFAVTRPVTVLMMLLAILVVGVIAYTRIPISMFPEGHEATSLNVYVSYPNATPRDIEQKITRKIEDIIGTVPNVSRVYSYSSSGTSSSTAAPTSARPTPRSRTGWTASSPTCPRTSTASACAAGTRTTPR
jgi:HAE1 family hydrophobic/amphiphilic exporter-1